MKPLRLPLRRIRHPRPQGPRTPASGPATSGTPPATYAAPTSGAQPPAGRFLLLAAALLACLLLGAPEHLTGDEPRYFMYARSFIEHGRFVMAMPEWRSLTAAVTGHAWQDLPTGAGGAVLMNGVYLPILLSPLALLGLGALRFATLLAGLAGLHALLSLCRRTGDERAALVAVAVAAFTVPLLPYLHLFYMETFLFALVSAAWWRLQTPDRGAAGDLLTAALLLAIPFVHLRGAVVAAALFGLLLWQNRPPARRRRALGLVALAAAALAVFVTANLAIYGAVTGPVNTARPPWPSQWFAVLSMQLFNVHHGLFAYAPVWMLGYGGLVVGAWRGSVPARQGLVLALIAAVTGVGVNPGECWPARFWVLSTPMLAVGLCAWWHGSRGPLLRGLTVALIAFTLLNTAIFLDLPNAFLENRQVSTTYQALFDRFGHFDLGLVLPVETDDLRDTRMAALMTAGAVLFIAFAVAGALVRPAWAWGGVALLLVTLDAAAVRVVPPAAYRVEPGIHRVTLTFAAPGGAATPIEAGYVQLGQRSEVVYAPPRWPHFEVVTFGRDGGMTDRIHAAREVIPISCQGAIGSVIVASVPGFDIAAEARARLVVYRSRSLLWRGLARLRGRC